MKKLDQTEARWRVRFFGQVQHVGFRYTAYYLARKLALTGWVRNLPDGSVLMEAQGAAARLRKFLMQLKSQPHLRIEKYEIDLLPMQPDERGFQVRSGFGG